MALKNRHLVFAKNCNNTHGHFVKGDVARGAFSDQLVADYLAVGILVDRTPPKATLIDEGDKPTDVAETTLESAEQAETPAPTTQITPRPKLARKR